MCPAQPVNAVAGGLPSGQPLPGPGLGDFQIQLLSALMAQTEALNRLASSNEGLTNAVAQLLDEVAGNEGAESSGATYMDGTPVR
jgi:hypothetical protein